MSDLLSLILEVARRTVYSLYWIMYQPSICPNLHM